MSTTSPGEPLEERLSSKKCRLRQPRSRRRKGKGQAKKTYASRPEVITLSHDPGLKLYSPESIEPDCPRKRAIKIRNSKRWYTSLPTPRVGWQIPYIDRLGRFSGKVAYLWDTDPRCVVASVTSTILSRLFRHCLRHNKYGEVNKKRSLLARVSSYYSLTKNNYMWDRILFLTKDLVRNGTLIHKLFLKFLSKTDGNKRFVISRVCFQTQWLLFRAERPRDKSAQRVLSTSVPGIFIERSLGTLVNATTAIWESAVRMTHLS